METLKQLQPELTISPEVCSVKPNIYEVSREYIQELLDNKHRINPDHLTYNTETHRINEAVTTTISKETTQGLVELTIDSHGALATSYKLNSTEVLSAPETYATYYNEDTSRGGIPLTVPNMGRDSYREFRMHGILETALMQFDEYLSSPEEGRLVHFVLGSEIPGEHPFPDDGAIFVIHELDDEGGLTTTMQIYNGGDTDLALAPGFHPYFKTIIPSGFTPEEYASYVALRELPVPQSEITLDSLSSTIQISMNQAQILDEKGRLKGINIYPQPNILINTIPLVNFMDAHAEVWAWTDKFQAYSALELAAGVRQKHIHLAAGNSAVYAARIIAKAI